MRGIQCWARLPDGTRCGCQVLPDRYFCAQHGRMACHRDPSLVFLAPVDEMPGDLVDQLRAAAPGIAFPATSPASVPEPEAPLPAPSVLPPEQHPRCPPAPGAPAGAREASPDRTAEPPEAPADGRGREPEGAPLDWLLHMLKAAMVGVMEGDSLSLQKANAVARLGGLYLKAYGAAELKRENALLRKQLAQLEQRLAAVEPPSRDEKTGRESSPGEASLEAHPGGRGENDFTGAKKGRPGAPSEKGAERSPGMPGDPVVQPPSGLPEPASSPHRRRGSSPPHKPGRSGNARRR